MTENSVARIGCVARPLRFIMGFALSLIARQSRSAALWAATFSQQWTIVIAHGVAAVRQPGIARAWLRRGADRWRLPCAEARAPARDALGAATIRAVVPREGACAWRSIR